MKIWKLFILLSLAFVACSREGEKEEKPVSGMDIEGLPVTISFSVAGPDLEACTTKSADGLDNDDLGGLETLHLAVFGGSGYLKEYVPATLTGEGEYTYQVDKKVQKKDNYDNPLYYVVTTDPVSGDEVVTEETTTADTGHPVFETIKIDHTVPVYQFRATVAMSNSPRTIHFLGNGPETGKLPFGWDSDIIPVQLSQLKTYTQSGSEEEQTLKAKAYWQMVSFPEGITAKKLPAIQGGYYYSKHGYRYGVSREEDAQFKEDGGFQIDDDVAQKFRMIPLIRNWSKIVLYAMPKEVSNFEAISLAVINVPSRGALAPYNAAAGRFVQGYEQMGFDDLRDIEQYPASLPSGTIFDSSIPSHQEFDALREHPESFQDGDRVAPASSWDDLYDENGREHAVYLYERPAPSDNIPPSYVIIYGRFFEHPEDASDQGQLCYYKVDLMETITDENGDRESRYYPIYRNFKYQIHVSKILSKGHDTPQAAAASAGSADVSADVTTGHLSDISDGVGRIHLNWMAKTYTGEYEETTLSVFYSNPEGEAIMGQEGVPEDPMQPTVLPRKYVKVELLPPTDKKKDAENPENYDNVIDPASIQLMPPSTNTTDGTYGWRQIKFRVKALTGKVARTQSIRITGVHADGKIYRDVVVSVLPRQPLWVKCSEPRLLPEKEQPQTVSIGIPDGLIKSMFPLEFKIEADRMTLTPVNSGNEKDNMPVVSGPSISLDAQYAGKPAFQFLRTITWDEYRALPTKDQDERIWRVITCHFMTNCEDNHAKVWIANEYFIFDEESSCDSFENYNFKRFTELCFPEPVPCWENKPVTVRIALEPNGTNQGMPTYPEVRVSLRGMAPPSEGSPLEGDVDTYSFTPTYSPLELVFYTTNDEGDLAIDLEADDYYPVHLEPYHFNKDVPKGSYGLLEGMKVGNTYSNMAYGRVESGWQYENKKNERNVIFGYYDDPVAKARAAVKITDIDGDALQNTETPSNGSRLVAVTPSSFVDYWTPTETKTVPNYHEIFLKTPTAGNKAPDENDISFLLMSPGYVTQEFTYRRMRRTRLHTYIATSGNINSWFHDNGDGTWSIIPAVNNDECYYHIVIKPLDGAPDPIVNSNGLYLGGGTGTGACAGGRYKITVKSGDVAVSFTKSDIYRAQRCNFFQFTIEQANKPANVEPQTGGTCFLYPGSDKLYQWITYDNALEYPGNAVDSPSAWSPAVFEESIIFTVGTDHPIRISGYMYKGFSEVP